MLNRDLQWLNPGAIAQRTGGYIYNARMIGALRAAGWTIYTHELPGDWPAASEAALRDCAAIFENFVAGSTVIADGLLWTGLGELRGTLLEQHTVVVLVHSFLDQEPALRSSPLANREDAALDEAHGLICTSPLVARLLVERLAGSEARVRTVCPGTDRAPRAAGSNAGRLLAVGTVTPRKGVRELVAALASPKMELDLVVLLRTFGTFFLGSR